jgi:hypothetical protein
LVLFISRVFRLITLMEGEKRSDKI